MAFYFYFFILYFCISTAGTFPQWQVVCFQHRDQDLNEVPRIFYLLKASACVVLLSKSAGICSFIQNNSLKSLQLHFCLSCFKTLTKKSSQQMSWSLKAPVTWGRMADLDAIVWQSCLYWILVWLEKIGNTRSDDFLCSCGHSFYM